MGRALPIERPAQTAAFPRPGEPIVPAALQRIVFDRHPSSDTGAAHLLTVARAGVAAWRRFSPEICRRVGAAVVDRVQSRLQQLPEATLGLPLPGPATALAFRLERRTVNTLRRALSAGADGPWTLERYLGVPRFGGRAVVDLLAAVEANEGPLGWRARDSAARHLEDRVAFAVRNLPISEENLRKALHEVGAPSEEIDLSGLARSWVQRGHAVPFRVVEIGGVKIAVGLSQVTATRIAYRIALRAVGVWGAASIHEIAEQLRAGPIQAQGATFVEKLFASVGGFRWVDRSTGWFWFAGAQRPFSLALRKTPRGRRRRPGSKPRRIAARHRSAA
jgi:hypothetical protein